MNKPARKKADASKKTDPKDTRIAELTDDLQRVQADFINYKRREAENDSFRRTQAKVEIISQLLPFIDNLERALVHAPSELAEHEYVKGVASTAKQFDEVLKKLGVEKINTVNEVFDPELMNAVAMEDGDGEQEIVTEELQSGYLLDGTVIRHAMVKVKKG